MMMASQQNFWLWEQNCWRSSQKLNIFVILLQCPRKLKPPTHAPPNATEWNFTPSWAIPRILTQFCHVGANCNATQLTPSIKHWKMGIATSNNQHGQVGTMATSTSNTPIPFVWPTQSIRKGGACNNYKIAANPQFTVAGDGSDFFHWNNPICMSEQCNLLHPWLLFFNNHSNRYWQCSDEMIEIFWRNSTISCENNEAISNKLVKLITEQRLGNDEKFSISLCNPLKVYYNEHEQQSTNSQTGDNQVTENGFTIIA